MTAIVTRGDAANLHLPDETVDLVVTSPPYFGLRSYQDGGQHYDGQIGAEPTPAEYLDALIACTREWMRVLKPGGSIFVNLGDSYSSGGRKTRAPDSSARRRGFGEDKRPQDGHKPKTLIGTPWRYAIRCIDELGLILRAEIVWSKPNGLPESVTDRVRRSHEQVFHFVRQPRYYAAVDEIREPHSDRPEAINMRRVHAERAAGLRADPGNDNAARGRNDETTLGKVVANPLGKLPGSVWPIPTAPLRVPPELGIDHFAAYPPELVRRIVLGWSPREVCTACGEGRRPNRGRACDECGEFIPNQGKRCTACGHVRDWKAGRVASAAMGATDWSTAGHGTPRHPGGHVDRSVVDGYTCACPDTAAPATPGVVLDPFGGTGTTALVASVHGRVGISVDLSADYCRLAQWRTTDEKQRAKAAGAKPKTPRKPKPQPAADVVPLDIPGQTELFDLEEPA